MSEEKLFTKDQAQLEFAKSIYNSIWGLLNKTDRSPLEDEEILLCVFASLYYWR